MTTLAALSLHFPFVWYGFLLLFGLALGSFYNVVIYRLPRMLTQTADDERITLSTPGSSCPQCRQPIAWRDNIPLLSFLWLGRRARCCQAPIAWSYPLTELATGLLFILAGALLAPGLPLAGGLVLLSFLLILARIDARTQLLPDRLTLPLLWAGLLFNLNEVYIALPDAVAGAMAGYLALWSVYWLFRLLTGKEALGYGDFKLLAALGAWCGWQVLPQVLLLASASGLVWTLLQRLWTRQSLQQPLAFGPWLALAGGGIFLWQQMDLAFANRLAGQDAARQRRLRVFFAAAGRGGVGRIVRPDVLRIASLHLFLHLAVAPLPEGAQIAGDLQRTLGRRQQLQHQRHPPLGDHRRRGLAEHLLHTHRQRWRVLRMVSDRQAAAGRHGIVRRQLAIQLLAQRPWQPVL